MSWQVDGRLYHDYSEYQAALRHRDEQQARAEAGRLRDRVVELQSRIQNGQEQLSQANSNLDEQRRVSAAIQRDVRSMQRAQEQLAQAQARMEREAEQRFQSLIASVDQTRDDVQALERAHRHHVEAVRAEFGLVRREVDDALQEADRRRRETETRLLTAIGEVDRKFEADRQERLAKQRTQTARALAALDVIEAMLRTVEPRLEVLNLADQDTEVRALVREAHVLVQAGDPESALGVSQTAHAQSRALVEAAARRGAELTGFADYLRARCEYVRSLLTDDEARRYFAREVRQVDAVIDVIHQRAGQDYTHHRKLDIRGERDEEILDGVEAQALAMVAAAPSIKDLAAERVERGEALVKQVLTRIYGPLSAIQQRYDDPEDRKSALVVECKFGGTRVDLHLDLDGTYRLDGYGHPNNQVCARRAEAVIASLKPVGRVDGQQVDSINRDAPARRVVRASRWRAIGARVAHLEQKVR